MGHRLLIVSNRLPINVTENNGKLTTNRSSGGLATALASLPDTMSSAWIGWTGLRRKLTSKELQSLNLAKSINPINLSESEVECFYDTFSNGIMWPLNHGLEATATMTEKVWDSMQTVIGKFADAIEAAAQPDDLIWIHDYHLFMLPAELRRRGMKQRMGFFLHTPFPPAATLPHIPHVKELMSSLLSVDLLGLQVMRDVDRFEEMCQQLKIDRKAHRATVRDFPIGIDFESFNSLDHDEDVQEHIAEMEKDYDKRTVILSLSRLDYTKGLLSQLHAIEILLEQLEKPDSIIYRLNVAPSRESVEAYDKLKHDIENLVSKINKRFGTDDWQPVEYTYINMPKEEVAGLFRVADIHLNTPVADGMNLVAKEYVASRREPGVLIISSSMGASDQLEAAISIDPEDPAAASGALSYALSMSRPEMRERWNALRYNVQAEQVSDWANEFVETLVNQ